MFLSKRYGYNTQLLYDIIDLYPDSFFTFSYDINCMYIPSLVVIKLNNLEKQDSRRVVIEINL